MGQNNYFISFTQNPKRSFDLRQLLHYHKIEKLYQEDFKIAEVYVNTYPVRLQSFINEFNSHATENDFLQSELETLNDLKFFDFSIPFDSEIKDPITFELTLACSEFYKSILPEYHELITDTYYYLHLEQVEIKEYLSKLIHYIEKNSLNDIEGDNYIIETQNTLTYRLKVLHSTGILHFIKSQFSPRNSKSYAQLLKFILNIENNPDIGSQVNDYFGNIKNFRNKKDFRRSDNDYDEIENFLRKHFSKVPEKK